jgi:uncharacterized protein (TIGR00369 family)
MSHDGKKVQEWTAGERYQQMLEHGRPDFGGIWDHLGWTLGSLEPGRGVLEWETTTDHAFPTMEGGWIVHGGMVTALLDTAMGQATWTLLNNDEVFLTADLRTEFYRPTYPGVIRAAGWVVHKSQRTTFAAAELFDVNGKLLASARATNMTLKSRT